VPAVLGPVRVGDTVGTSLLLHKAPRTDDPELLSCLERMVRDQDGQSATIATLGRRPLESDGPAGVEVLSLLLGCGEQLELLLKDFGRRLPPSEAAQRCEQERRVYRVLLAGADLGTPRYYGTVSDPCRGRFWTLLEFFPGQRLRWREAERFVAAGAWLGRAQAHFARYPERLESCPFLARHDAQFFRYWAYRALRAAERASDSLGRRLARVVQKHSPWIEAMASDPPTLVHGSFRRHHILVGAGPGAPRVCPVSWESAVLGSPLYDLAFLSEGCQPPILERMWEAYRDALTCQMARRPDRWTMESLVTCFRLHRIERTLGEAPEGELSERVVARLISSAERLARTLEQR